jgi:hypothetical protein
MRAFAFVALIVAFVPTTSTSPQRRHSDDVVVVALPNDTVTFDCDDHRDDHILWKKSVTPSVTELLTVQHQVTTFPSVFVMFWYTKIVNTLF